jgi:hypothetical protein
MKCTFFKSAAVLSVMLFLSFSTQAKSYGYAYSRQSNKSIGVAAANKVAVGRSYSICNEKGKVIMKGVIKSMETFYIDTEKLANGTYTFKIDGEAVQKFTIK